MFLFYPVLFCFGSPSGLRNKKFKFYLLTCFHYREGGTERGEVEKGKEKDDRIRKREKLSSLSQRLIGSPVSSLGNSSPSEHKRKLKSSEKRKEDRVKSSAW